MTDLTDIYDAVASLEITMADGEAIPAWTLDQVKDKVVSDHLPIRILLPPGADGAPAVQALDMVSFAQTVVTWRVTELMLYRPIAQRGGLRNIWKRLTEYVATYTATVMSREERNLTTRAVTIGVEPQAAVLEWPRGSGTEYHGVQTTLLVQETIC